MIRETPPSHPIITFISVLSSHLSLVTHGHDHEDYLLTVPSFTKFFSDIISDTDQLGQGGGGLHSRPRGAGHDVAADHDVGLHQGVPVRPDAGHQVGEGRVLGLGHGGHSLTIVRLLGEILRQS